MRDILKHKLTWTVIIIIILILLSLFLISKTNKKNMVDLTFSALADSIFSSVNIATSTVTSTKLFDYIKIINSCDYEWKGGCVNMRSGADENFPVVAKLRNGIILKVKDKIEVNGHTWYKIIFDEWLRYPERVTDDLYVAGDFVELFKNEGPKEITTNDTSITTKRIIIDREEQTLYAYDGDTLFMKEKISTGLELTPTPRGVFKVYRKTPSRYMQGPIPDISEQNFDLPGVPWNLYFSNEGAVIHGAYWHNDFGKVHSSGCVNLPPSQAEKLYHWAELGTKIMVRD